MVLDGYYNLNECVVGEFLKEENISNQEVGEDEELILHKLDSLKEVFGSQSVLSQEIQNELQSAKSKESPEALDIDIMSNDFFPIEKSGSNIQRISPPSKAHKRKKIMTVNNPKKNAKSKHHTRSTSLANPRSFGEKMEFLRRLQESNNNHQKKQVLLSLALMRMNPRQYTNAKKFTDFTKGHKIHQGFLWSHYPPLEKILHHYKLQYYQYSFFHKQSKEQTEFNNALVCKIKEEVSNRGWIWDDNFIEDDRHIRDRIRCFYKSILQNSKKRLRTMLNNPQKQMNRKNLDDCFTFLQPLLDDPDFDNDILINNIGISESLSSLIKYKNIGTVTEKGMLSDDTNISQSIVNDGELGSEDESISCISTVHDTSIEHMLDLGFVKLSQDSEIVKEKFL